MFDVRACVCVRFDLEIVKVGCSSATCLVSYPVCECGMLATRAAVPPPHPSLWGGGSPFLHLTSCLRAPHQNLAHTRKMAGAPHSSSLPAQLLRAHHPVILPHASLEDVGQRKFLSYQHVAFLGSGGFAEVAKYVDKATGMEVAIKSVNKTQYRSGVNLGAVKELQAMQEVARASSSSSSSSSSLSSSSASSGAAEEGHPNVVKVRARQQHH